MLVLSPLETGLRFHGGIAKGIMLCFLIVAGEAPLFLLAHALSFLPDSFLQ